MLKFLYGTPLNKQFTIDTIDLSFDATTDINQIVLCRSPHVLCLCNSPPNFQYKHSSFQYSHKTFHSVLLSKFPLIPVSSYPYHVSLYGRLLPRPIECVIVRIDFPTHLNHLLVFTNIPDLDVEKQFQTDAFFTTKSNLLHYAYTEIHSFLLRSIKLLNPTKTLIFFTGDFATTITTTQTTSNEIDGDCNDCHIVSLFIKKKIMEQLKYVPLLGIGKTYLKECANWIQKIVNWDSGKSDGLCRFLDELQSFCNEINCDHPIDITYFVLYNIVVDFCRTMNVCLKADVFERLLLGNNWVVTHNDFQTLYEPLYNNVLLANRGGRYMNKDFMMLETIIESTSINSLMENPILTDRTLHTLITNTFTKNGAISYLSSIEKGVFENIPSPTQRLPYKMKGITVSFTIHKD